MLGVVALVLFVHFGGNNVPEILRDNKQMIYGLIIGVVLCSFFGLRVEGHSGIHRPIDDACQSNTTKTGGGGSYFIPEECILSKVGCSLEDFPSPEEYEQKAGHVSNRNNRYTCSSTGGKCIKHFPQPQDQGDVDQVCKRNN